MQPMGGEGRTITLQPSFGVIMNEFSRLTLEPFWRGYVSGTNRGPVDIRISQQGENLEATAIIQDQMFGPAIISLIGKLEGSRTDLRLVHFRGFAPFVPLDGQITLNFDKSTAEGSWQTDIGTTGTCKLRVTSIWTSRWWSHLAAIKLRFFCCRYGRLFYVIFLLFIAIFGLLSKLQVSYSTLVLLLLPAPYIFREQLAELVQLFRASGVRKVGPLEFQPLLTDDIRRIITQLIAQRVRDTVAFGILDGFFVVRTKLALIWLNQNQTVDRAQFNGYATAIGVPADNLDATWNALIISGCCTLLADGRLTMMDFGRRYVDYLAGQS